MARTSSGILLAVALAAAACRPGSGNSRDSYAPTPSKPEPGAPGAAASPPPDPREAILSTVVVRLLEGDHLLHKKIDDSVSRVAFETYMDRLDAGKMFLRKSDRESLAKYIDKIDDELRSGSLDLAHAGSELFIARVHVVEGMVAKILAAPMNHNDEEWIEVDPEKLQLAASDDELRDRWRRRLELEVLDRVAQMEARLQPDKTGAKDKDADDPSVPVSQIPPTPEGRETKAREDLAKSYAARFVRLSKPEKLDPAADLINAVATSLDPHTNYLPPADKANFDIHMTGQVEGIGAVLREHEHLIEVLEVVPGGAAWTQGDLDPGDLILTVTAEGKDPVDVFDMRIDDVVKMIRGPKGTVVRLRVQKPSGENKAIAITRDVVKIDTAYARGAVLSPGNGKAGKESYGYINVPSFYGGSGADQRTAAEDVAKLLRELKGRKVDGVILDLRGNGGGFLGEAVEMTGALIDRGPVVQVQNSQGKRELFADKNPGTAYDGPVIVLVDRFSASASEIVAGALQDYHRAVIVGTGPTHGKGTVQTVADLDRATGGQVELGTMKVTTQQFFRVTGSSTQRQGVVPEVVLPDPAGHVDTGERELEHAIEWSQIDAVPYRALPQAKIPMLVQKSAARVAKHPVLAKIATTIQLLRTKQKDTRVPLAKAAWEARRKELKAALDTALPDTDKLPARMTVKTLDDPALAATKARPGGKTDNTLTKWRDNLSRDPWLEETVNILHDMGK